MKRHFHEIKRLFFPRWDRQNEWKLRMTSARKCQGHCDRERKVIEIVARHIDPDDQDHLLIHEICHAVTKGFHGREWQCRMEMAAERADELGRTRLSKLIREEVVRRREQGEGIRLTYELVKEWVQSVPDVTLPQLEKALAEENGVNVSELRQRLKRLEKVFREAKSDVLESRRMKAKFMAAAKRG